MKIAYLIVTTIISFSQLGFATENSTLSANVQEQIETQTRDMSAVGVPTEAARNMLTMMHRNRFRDENIVRAQHEVINCAKAGLPTEPVMSKALEGLAKQASEQQIIAAMVTVHSRYAQSNHLAKTMSEEKQTVDTITQTIAGSLAAGMKTKDIEKLTAQLKIQKQTKNKTDSDKLAIQTMQTTRTMARLGIRSSDVSDTLCQALKNNYNYQEMKQLRHQISKQTHKTSHQKIANQHARAIGKSGSGSGSGGSGSGSGGSGSGSGGSGGGSGGSGSGGSGSGSGGNGSGSGGSGSGSGGSGSGSGGNGSGSGGNGSGSGGSGSGSGGSGSRS